MIVAALIVCHLTNKPKKQVQNNYILYNPSYSLNIKSQDLQPRSLQFNGNGFQQTTKNQIIQTNIQIIAK